MDININSLHVQVYRCKANISTTDIWITARNYFSCNWLGIYDIKMCQMKVVDFKDVGVLRLFFLI
jgi:hypothetical protein